MTRAAHAILADALHPPDPGTEPAWGAEIRRRVTAIEAGTENLEPWEKVRRRIERKIRNR
ncbi:MAG: addiction module protein [Acidobacteriota bacterium]|nr:addiction module protein [Acidobacteriota bacterium]